MQITGVDLLLKEEGRIMRTGKGEKGSQFWIQKVISEDELRNEMNKKIGDVLHWISPLEKENYAEYELSHKVIREKLNIRENEKIFSFWPTRQPQWDGLAISEDGKTFYLIEAKAHLGEMKSIMKAKNPESIDSIIIAMKKIHDKYYPLGDFEKWKNGYYQLANRLTFLKKMQESKEKFKNIENFKLVFLNFVNDYTHKSTKEEKWNEYYQKVFQIMIGNNEPPTDVILINFEV